MNCEKSCLSNKYTWSIRRIDPKPTRPSTRRFTRCRRSQALHWFEYERSIPKERIDTRCCAQAVFLNTKTIDIKGKEYSEVNQRIKAFRMVYPDGFIDTSMLSNENGVCIEIDKEKLKKENNISKD